MSAEIDHVRHVILGIGIDVNQTTSDFTGELSTTRDLIEACFERPLTAPGWPNEFSSN